MDKNGAKPPKGQKPLQESRVSDNPQKFVIDSRDLTFKYTKSSGPGGQNVNKLNTRAVVYFDVARAANLTQEQKIQILGKLRTRASKMGVIRVVSQSCRTQKANQEAAIERLRQLIENALKVKSVRKKTRVSYSSRQKRLQKKKLLSLKKKQRYQKDFTGQ